GKTIDGIELEGKAALTHVIPAGPVILSRGEGDEVDPNNVVISWEPVTETITGSGDIVIVGYQVVVDGGESPPQV
ncbi:MAG: hypothetical protein ACREQK_04270, partial [Candidatus Binatia bacterium]